MTSASHLFPGVEINTSATDHFALQSLVPTMIEADGTLTALSDPISVE